MKKLVLSLFMCCAVFVAAFAQERVITGTVTASEDGLPIPGVSVKVSNATTVGTTTGADGKFSLRVPASARELTFSYLGYVAQTKAISGTTVNVTLTADSKALSEVIVTGLGQSRAAASVGYSVQRVGGEDLTVAKAVDVSNALAGKVAGVKLVGSPSSAFGNADIIIRGVKGLGLATPLFVVDGTPTAQENILMDNVDNISVLKGAAATAVWGSRGQNGVVLITSKKGTRNSAAALEVNLGVSLENLSLKPDYQDEYGGGSKSGYTDKNSLGAGYLDDEGFYIFNYDPGVHPASWAAFQGQRMLEYGNDESWGPKMNGQQYRPYYSWFPGADFGKTSAFVPQPNNVEDFFQTGRNLNNSIAFTGGTDKFNYRLTYANQNRTLIVPGSRRDNNQVGFSASYDISPKFTVSTDINYRRVKTIGNLQEGYRNDGLNVPQNFNQWWHRQLDIEKLKDYKLPDGSYQSWNIGDPNGTARLDTKVGGLLRPQYWDSPYFTVEKNYGTSKANYVFGNLGLNYKITNWLNWDNRVRLDFNDSFGDFRIATGGVNLVDSYDISSNTNTEFNYESNLNIRKTFGDFSLDGAVGINLRTNRQQGLSMSTAGGLTFPDFFSIEASVARPTTANTINQKDVRSVLGRASLGYKSFLYLDATVRNDWSSALPESDNSYIYPSVSTSFVFSELIKNSGIKDILTFGKVRGSWAQVGSDLGFNSTLIAISGGNIFDGNASASIGNQYRSGLIKPSLTRSFEVGAELKFWNRVGIDFAWYRDNSINQILGLTIPGSTGFQTAQINAGDIQSKGMELSLTGSPIKSSTFTWNMGLNFATNESLVKELSPLQKTVIAGTSGLAPGVRIENREGAEFGMLVGRNWQRNAAGQVIVGANGQPLFNSNVDLGTVLPKWTGGFYSSFNYKGIDLAFSIDFQKDGLFFSHTTMFVTGDGLGATTVGLNDKGGDIRDYPGAYTLAGGNVGKGGIKVPNSVFANGNANNRYISAKSFYYTAQQNESSNFVINASYIKLREVRLGYQIPKKLLGNVPVKSVNLGVTVGNAWLISGPSKKYGVDPSELETYWQEGGQLSQTRQFGLNLRASF
ncbi:MAG: SusC/RagA family TonB-linked outer membrane protein [Pedobacter sp.]|nr:SusC/RagA family TonB-linked outer membrane protein [Pedobacter sp.]